MKYSRKVQKKLKALPIQKQDHQGGDGTLTLTLSLSDKSQETTQTNKAERKLL